MDFDLNFFGEETIRKKLWANVNSREIVIWGYWEYSHKLKKWLEDRGGRVAFYVDKDEYKCSCFENCFESSILKGGNDKYFICIPTQYHQDIEECLHEYGYNSSSDYLFFHPKPTVLNACSGFIDIKGNEIRGIFDNSSISFTGYNASVNIGSRTKLKDCNISIANNAVLEIGKNCVINNLEVTSGYASKIKIGENCIVENLKIKIDDCSNLEIGNNSLVGSDSDVVSDYYIANNCYVNLGAQAGVSFSAGNIVMCSGSKLLVGKNTSCISVYNFTLGPQTSVTVGDDCMFSYDIFIRTFDGHKIKINGIEKKDKKEIVIGNHVWLGAKTTVLYGAYIGDGSMTGTGSVVKGVYGKNQCIAGVPARVIHENIEWSR